MHHPCAPCAPCAPCTPPPPTPAPAFFAGPARAAAPCDLDPAVRRIACAWARAVAVGDTAGADRLLAAMLAATQFRRAMRPCDADVAAAVIDFSNTL